MVPLLLCLCHGHAVTGTHFVTPNSTRVLPYHHCQHAVPNRLVSLLAIRICQKLGSCPRQGWGGGAQPHGGALSSVGSCMLTQDNVRPRVGMS